MSSERAAGPPPATPPAVPPALPSAPPAPAAPPPAVPAPPHAPGSPWGGDGAAPPTPQPAAPSDELGLDAAAAGLPELGRRSRRWADATAAIALLVSAGAVLAAASPAIGRTFNPDPPVAARRGLGQAIRLRGLALGAPAEGPSGEGRDVAPDLEERGDSRDDDPLAGSDRSDRALERLDPWRREGRGRPRAEGAEPDAQAQGGADGAPRYRLGMAAVGTVLRERPERDGAVLAQVAQGEVLLVAAAVEGWLYVAFSTEQGTVAGWVQRTEVVLP